MARTYKLIVKRLPRKVCVSIRSAKGRTLTKKRNVSYRKKGKRGKRRKRKIPWMKKGKGGYWSKCARRTKRMKRKPRNVQRYCRNRYRAGLRP